MLLRTLRLSALVGWARPVVADRVALNNGDRLSRRHPAARRRQRALKTRYAGQVPIACKDIDTWRSGKPLLLRRASTATNRRARLSLPYELEQMGGLGRTSPERHYLLGSGSAARLVPSWRRSPGLNSD